jgi:hypothetical protein
MMSKKILVIANETAAGDELQAAIGGPGGATQVLVVAPALDSRVRRWHSDSGAAEQAARARLRTCLARLAARGIEAEGTVGDGDPLHAALDVLQVFPADEIVVSIHPENRSYWPARRLVERLAEHFDGPILHVVAREEPALAAA